MRKREDRNMTKPCGQMNTPIRTAAYPCKKKKGIYSQTKSVNQTPDLGARRRVWEHEKAYSGREGGKKRTQGGNKRTYTVKRSLFQTPDLSARTGVWNGRRPILDERVERNGPAAKWSLKSRHLPRSRRRKGGSGS